MEVDDRTYNPIVSYENAEQKPEFNPKDGYEAYIKENLHYPNAAAVYEIECTVVIAFVIDRNGNITKARIEKSSGYREMDYEALRVIKKMPRWIPGKVNGHPIAVTHSISVEFEIGE